MASFFQFKILRTLLLLVCSLVMIAIFIAMKNRSLYIWDEAIYANNAIEMLLRNNYWQYTADFKLDLYNTKPPLLLWLQAFSMKVFGMHVMALRLPTLLALMGVVGTIFIFSKKYYNLLIGIFSVLIVLTTPALISPHVFLGGNLDGMLVFFTTVIWLGVITLGTHKKLSTKKIYGLTFLFFLGFLTKSTAIFLILPSMIFILFRNYSLLPLLKKRSFYVSLFLTILGIAAYYYLKELYQPGTVERVFFSEFQRLYTDVMPWHRQPLYFYFERIYEQLNPYYLWVSIILLPIYFFIKNTHYKKTVLTLYGSIIIYLLLISIPHSKLDWYAAPIFPIWALANGMLLYELLAKVSIRFSNLHNWLPQLLLLAFFTIPVISIFKHIKKETTYYADEEKEMAFLMSEEKRRLPKEIKILSAYPQDTSQFFGHNHHNDVILFYQKSLKFEGYNIQLKYDHKEFKSDDVVIYSESKQQDSLLLRFRLREIHSNQFGRAVRLLSPR